MSGCRCSPTPLVPREKIMSLSEDPTQEKASVSDHKRFMKAVGSIQYIAAVSLHVPPIPWPGTWQAVQRNIG